MPAPAPALDVAWLGRVPYGEALRIQQEAVAARRRGSGPDRLLLLEHPPVVTLGRSGREENLRLAPDELAARGIELHRVGRGGDVTYHGPGQLVGYAIVDLAARGAPDVHRWLRTLEGALLDALGALGVKGARREGMTGVFVHGAEPPRKLASIGVGLRGWVTWHGFALNATLDPEQFDCIVPCGLHGVAMTSVARELAVRGAPPEATLFARTREAVAEAFLRRLDP
ncbi:MAG: lipoyl(octanoyl) transferase LipB [Myxococcota bacterium]|nr:lipoyl(octanoyl) transferase LipB [Myxococcota bacterium]